MNSVSPICCFRSNRTLSVQPKHTTRCHRLHNRRNILPLIHPYLWSSSTQWILSSTSITFLSMCCTVTPRSNPFMTNSRRPFLEIDVKGGERDHIKAYHFQREREYHLHRGRKRSPGGENTSRKNFSRIPDAWCSRGEMPHVFLRGKTCSYMLICISSVHLFPWALIFCSLSSPSIPC